MNVSVNLVRSAKKSRRNTRKMRFRGILRLRTRKMIRAESIRQELR